VGGGSREKKANSVRGKHGRWLKELYKLQVPDLEKPRVEAPQRIRKKVETRFAKKTR